MNLNTSNQSTDQEATRLNDEATLPTLTVDQYQRKMQRRKEVQEQRLTERNHEKGLIIVHTGNGKGKTTAALGMVLRSLGHGHRVAIVQFIKGAWEPAEKKVFGLWQNQLEFHAMGEGSLEPKTENAISRKRKKHGKKLWHSSAIQTSN